MYERIEMSFKIDVPLLYGIVHEEAIRNSRRVAKMRLKPRSPDIVAKEEHKNNI
jgi:hypothetical protein